MNDELMADAEFALAVKAMDDAGTRDGKNSGGWIADGNTSEETLRELLRMWDEGDPAAPCSPSPFSGEWAGNPSIEDVISEETDCDTETLSPEESDELAMAYEDAFHAAWQEQAERTVRAMLPE